MGLELLWYHYIEVQNTLWYLFVLRMCWNYKGIPKYVKPSIFIRVHALSLKLGEGYSRSMQELQRQIAEKKAERQQKTAGVEDVVPQQVQPGVPGVSVYAYMGINNQSQSKFNTEIQKNDICGL